MKRLFAECFLILSFVVFVTGCNKNNNSVSDPNINPQDTTSTNQGAKWTLDTIKVIGSNAAYPQIVVDNSGTPHICYLDDVDGYVKYAVKSGNTWIVSNVDYVANLNGSVQNGGICSMAIDDQNNPHICYYSAYGYDPTHVQGTLGYKYAKKVGGSWVITNIALPQDTDFSYYQVYVGGNDCAIAVEKATGIAHISVFMFGRVGSALGYWKSGLSTAVIVDKTSNNSEPGEHNSIAVDSRGYPAISYQAVGTKTLRFAKWNGSSFQIETIAPMEECYWAEQLTSVKFDKNNNAHISYINYGNGYQYAYSTGTTWKLEKVPYSSGYPSLSLSIDPNNKPHFALVGTGVKHAFWNGSAWTLETVASMADHCSIAVDKNGKIHLVYMVFGYPKNTLVYASK